jgi:hypothetical protein
LFGSAYIKGQNEEKASINLSQKSIHLHQLYLTKELKNKLENATNFEELIQNIYESGEPQDLIIEHPGYQLQKQSFMRL